MTDKAIAYFFVLAGIFGLVLEGVVSEIKRHRQ